MSAALLLTVWWTFPDINLLKSRFLWSTRRRGCWVTVSWRRAWQVSGRGKCAAQLKRTSSEKANLNTFEWRQSRFTRLAKQNTSSLAVANGPFFSLFKWSSKNKWQEQSGMASAGVTLDTWRLEGSLVSLVCKCTSGIHRSYVNSHKETTCSSDRSNHVYA